MPLTVICTRSAAQVGTEYTDTKSLRYGHLMIMTDQDHDGSHIKGLLINMLHHTSGPRCSSSMAPPGPSAQSSHPPVSLGDTTARLVL